MRILLKFDRGIHHAFVVPLFDLFKGLHLIHQDLLDLLLENFVFILRFSQLFLKAGNLMVLFFKNCWVG